MSTKTTKDSKKTENKPKVAIADLAAKGNVRGGKGTTSTKGGAQTKSGY